jgi:hypothetical protein
MTDKIDVQQVDRDAAAEYTMGDYGWDYASPSAIAIREGKAAHDLAQAFARHRQSAETRRPEAQEGDVEAVARAIWLDQGHQMKDAHWEPPLAEQWDTLESRFREIAFSSARAAIAAMPSREGERSVEYGRIHTDGSRSGGQPVSQASDGGVTEADRQAAATVLAVGVGDRPAMTPIMILARINSGLMDDNHLVQAFARHRLATRQPQASDDVRPDIVTTADRLARRMGARFVPHQATQASDGGVTEADSEAIAASVVRSACETDPADYHHPNAVVITMDDLEVIVRNTVENHFDGRLAHSDPQLVERCDRLAEALRQIREISPTELWDGPDRYTGDRPSHDILMSEDVFEIVDQALRSLEGGRDE